MSTSHSTDKLAVLAEVAKAWINAGGMDRVHSLKVTIRWETIGYDDVIVPIVDIEMNGGVPDDRR